MDLRTTRREVARHVVLAVDGTADLASAPRLHDALQRLVTGAEPETTFAVDLDGTSLLDDTALGLLLGAAAQARAAGCELIVVCSDARLRQRLDETRFDRAVDVVTALSTTVANRPTDVS